MHYFTSLVDFILHLNTHLAALVASLGNWSYVILFLVIFAETGLIIAPFLPGDSLLFATGALSSVSTLNIHLTVILLMIAAILGNTVNYAIGYWIGPKIFHYPKSHWFNPVYLHKAHAFYQKYGGRAIVLARFIPILRTFAPFIAGIARMHWARFQLFNCIGSVAWVAIILYLGYFFGNSTLIQENFGYVVLVIIIFSLLPVLIQFVRQRRKKS
jgi:membrane-associated protein